MKGVNFMEFSKFIYELFLDDNNDVQKNKYPVVYDNDEYYYCKVHGDDQLLQIPKGKVKNDIKIASLPIYMDHDPYEQFDRTQLHSAIVALHRIRLRREYRNLMESYNCYKNMMHNINKRLGTIAIMYNAYSATPIEEDLHDIDGDEEGET